MDVKEQIQRDNNKAGVKFILILVIAALLGGIIGFCMLFFQGSGIEEIAGAIQDSLIQIAPGVSLVVTVVLFAAAHGLYRQARKMYDGWNEEDDEEMERIEKKLTISLLLISLITIQAFFFFAAGVLGLAELVQKSGLMGIFCNLVAMIVAIVCTGKGQKEVVDFEREMNPEKQGSVYDIDFAKKWENSCDEAEKMAIYKASYSAYKATQRCCMVLWIICAIGGMLWNIGLLPVTIVTIIWATQTISYCYSCMKNA